MQCIETAALHLLFFELLPFVSFRISFLSWPFLLNYIVHKATHPTRGVLVYKIKTCHPLTVDKLGLLLFHTIVLKFTLIKEKKPLKVCVFLIIIAKKCVFSVCNIVFPCFLINYVMKHLLLSFSSRFNILVREEKQRK